jgi:putative phosphoesterase
VAQAVPGLRAADLKPWRCDITKIASKSDQNANPHTGARIVGLISDTHGLLRDEAVAALRGSDLIVHAGDVGKPGILTALEKLAPVVAVRGNTDTERWARDLPETALIQAGTTMLYVLHNLKELDLDPGTAGFHIVISGHSHKPTQTERKGILYINPGSAGPRRFDLPVTVARLDLKLVPWQAEFIRLSR